MFNSTSLQGLRACEHCKFSSLERLPPPQIQQILFCKYGPPTPVLIPTAPNAASLQPMWPTVAPNHWCHRCEPKNMESAIPSG